MTRKMLFQFICALDKGKVLSKCSVLARSPTHDLLNTGQNVVNKCQGGVTLSLTNRFVY